MEDFFMGDDDTAQTTEQQNTTQENTESGAIALGDGGNNDYFAGMEVPTNDASGDATAITTEDPSAQVLQDDQRK